jgi:hypothetical protein
VSAFKRLALNSVRTITETLMQIAFYSSDGLRLFEEARNAECQRRRLPQRLSRNGKTRP